MQWIFDNKEWIFSGIGVLVVSLIYGLIIRNKMASKQSQKSGSNSKNYQAGGDINIGGRND